MKIPLTIEMGNPDQVIIEELEGRYAPQSSVAITYAFIMAQLGSDADWAKINKAITDRWKSKSALERIKKMAWKQYYQWAKEGK